MRLVKEALAISFAGIFVLCLAMSLSAADKSASSAKPGETGYVKDAVYHDARFGFSMAIPVDWREAKLRKEPSPERLLLVQRKPRIPLRLQDEPDLAVKPSIMIFADSTSMAPDAFFNYLRADTGKTDFKQKILAKSIFLEAGASNEVQVLDKVPVKIAGKDVTRLRVRLEYNVRVTSPGMKTPSQVNDFRVGYIYIVPFDGWLLYIEEVCENQFLESLQKDFDSAINSVTMETAGK